MTDCESVVVVSSRAQIETTSNAYLVKDDAVYRGEVDAKNRFFSLKRHSARSNREVRVDLETYTRRARSAAKGEKTLWTLTYDKGLTFERMDDITYDPDLDSLDALEPTSTASGPYTDRVYTMQWRTSATATCASAETSDGAFVVEMKAAGYCERGCTLRKVHDDDEDPSDWYYERSVRNKTFIRRIVYAVKRPDGVVIETCEHDDLVAWSKKGGSLTLDSDSFHASFAMGAIFGGSLPHKIVTKPGADAGAALLVAHLCVTAFSPRTIQRSKALVPDWRLVPGYESKDVEGYEPRRQLHAVASRTLTDPCRRSLDPGNFR